MAPVVPSKRRSLRAKVAAKTTTTQPAAASNTTTTTTTTNPPTSAEAPSNTKRDRRASKHASFVSRIEKSRAGAGSLNKRRRPGKKLVANLDSLADALPELARGDEEALRQLREGKVRHKSLRSRPGALKRKEKVVKGEVQRFGASLARLNAVGEQDRSQQQQQQGAQPAAAAGTADGQGQPGAPAETTSTSTSNRWAALRGFISATMEQNPAFVGK